MGKKALFLCECNGNISSHIDIDKVENTFNSNENTDIYRHDLLCGEEGKQWLKKLMKEKNYENVIIAACSPRQHESTFHKVFEESGFNPFLSQMANLREHCAWMHTNKDAATQKAIRLINGAISRTSKQTALEGNDVNICPDILVIGAGVAGVEAALMLSQKNRNVYLIEKNSCVGGHVTTCEDVYPNMECATCMLEEKLDEVLNNENINVILNSSVESIKGFHGNFLVNVTKAAEFIDAEACIGCSLCYEPCPVSVPNEYNHCMSDRKAVYVPFDGSLPNVPVIDTENCLRFKNEECSACKDACDFEAIDYNKTESLKNLKVGAIVVATGFEMYDLSKVEQLGYGKFKEVYNSSEFERIISSTGPTSGEIQLKNEKIPKKITIINCAGSRTEDHVDYCSGTCCSVSLKFDRVLKEKVEGVEINHIYTDWCLPGRHLEKFKRELSENGVNFIKIDNLDSLKVVQNNDNNDFLNKIYIKNNTENIIESDMVVLCGPMVPSKSGKDIFEKLQLETDKYGYIDEDHIKLNPVSSLTAGIYVVGAAAGPANISESVTQAASASGKILSTLIPGEKLAVEIITSIINDDECSGCKTCIITCPYDAVSFESQNNISKINEVLCKGCGTCTASCPSGAITSKHFTSKQITAELKGLLSGV